jgi:Ca2+-binding RTX toxin-like protein
VDWVDYESNSRGVVVDLSAGNASGAGKDRLTGIENIFGTWHDDRLTGDAGRNVLDGLGGNDFLHGADGNDRFVTAGGDDAYDGGPGTDVVDFRESWNSEVIVNLVAGTASGDGEDTMTAIEDVVGSWYDDLLIGDGFANKLNGYYGEDILRGGAGDDKLFGGANEDPYDEVNDNDVLYGGPGDDALIGGVGTDVVDFGSAPGPVTVDLSLGVATGDGADTVSGIENVNGSGYGDSLVGDDEPNVITGRAGDDNIIGAGGDDVIGAGPGDDDYQGGEGLDRLDFQTSVDGVNVDLTLGIATGQGQDTISAIENIGGSVYADYLIGDASDNAISGRAGADTIEGRDGADELRGGTGDDSLSGGSGADALLDGGGQDAVDGGDGDDLFAADGGDDAYEGGPGSDTIDFAAAEDGIEVDLALGTATGLGSDSLAGTENVLGTSFEDILKGDASANFLSGQEGADEISGGDGDDRLSGGGGDDVIDGGAGRDTVTYADLSGKHGFITADLAGGFATGDGEDTLVAIEDVEGSQTSDFLRGDDGSNRLSGGGGADILEGAGGDDLLEGGSGSDTGDGGDGFDTCIEVENALNCEA